jgi:hypothetical protein
MFPSHAGVTLRILNRAPISGREAFDIIIREVYTVQFQANATSTLVL